MRAGRLDVPGHVRVLSLGKERGYSEPRRLLEFYRLLLRTTSEGRHDACFAHMAPLFAFMGYPILRSRSIPITLWYTHTSVPLQLRLAEKVVDRALTASPTGFRIPSRKLVVTGHGIDTARFSPLEHEDRRDGRFRLLSVGRVAPVKGLETLLEATRQIASTHGRDSVALRVVGEADRMHAAYAERLRRQVLAAGLEDVVVMDGPVPPHAIVGEYRRADAVMHLGRSGLDKVILEAMSCAVPVISSYPDYAPIAAEVAPFLYVEGGDPGAIARSYEELLGMSPAERYSLGERLRDVVVRDHSLDRLARRLVTELVVRRPSPR